jgi:glycerol-3-phosphate acyltransferase PlsY
VLPLYKAFETSCSVLGHQTVFVTYNPAGSARALERGAIVGIALAALVAGTALVFAIVLVSREKQGAPLFNPFQEDLSEGLLDRDVGAGGQAPNA